MAENQEFNWEEVSTDTTSDIEKKNPIGNEQLTQSQSQDGQLSSLESDLGGQSTLPTDDRTGLRVGKSGTEYWYEGEGKDRKYKYKKPGGKVLNATSWQYEKSDIAPPTKDVVSDAEFTEMVPLDKEGDINLQEVVIKPENVKTQEGKFNEELKLIDIDLKTIDAQIAEIESVFNEVISSGGNLDDFAEESMLRNELLAKRDIYLDRKKKIEAGIRNVDFLEIIDDGIIGGTANRFKYFYDKALSGVSGLSSGAADIMLNLMANIPGMVPEGMSKDEALKIAKEDIKPAIKEGLVKTIGTDLDEQRREQYDSEFVTSAVGGLAESVPAMFSPYGTGLILQSYNGAIESINASEEGKNLPESTKTAFGLSVGIAQGLLEKYGLDKVLGLGKEAAEKVAVSAIKDLIKGGDNKITAEAFKNAAEKIVTNATKGATIEGLTGGTQEIATIGIEYATNLLKDKQIFNHGSWGELGSRVIQSAGQEAIGGGLLGGLKTVYDVASSNPKKELVNKIQQADGKVENIKDLIDAIDALDEASEEQKQQMKSKVTGMVERSKRIPEGITNPDARVQSDELLENIDKLRKQKEVIDEVYKKDIQNLIDEIGNDLLEIARTNKPVDKSYELKVEEKPKETKDPTKYEPLSEKLSKHKEVSTFIREEDNKIVLSYIYIPEGLREKGKGSAVLTDIKEYSDKTGKPITLTATEEFGGDLERLKNFYTKNGFENIEGNKFIYNPKETAPTESQPKSEGNKVGETVPPPSEEGGADLGEGTPQVSTKEQLEKNLEDAKQAFLKSSRSSLSSGGMQSVADFAKYVNAWVKLNGYRVKELIRDLRQYFGESEYLKQFKTDEDLEKHIEDARQGKIEKESKKISPSLKRAQDWAFAEGRTVGAIEQAKLDSKEAKKVNKEFDKERKATSKESQKLVDMAYDFGFAEGSEAGKFEQASKDYKEFEKEKKKLSKQEQERIDRAYKLGKTDGRRPGLEIMEIAKMLKDYINNNKEFKANINKSKNAKTILLNKVTKLIESTESKQEVKNKRLNDLLDYMDKLAEDGKYQDKLEEAQKNRKSIKLATPKSDKSIPVDLRNAYKKLYSINPTKLTPTELDVYNTLVSDFTKKIMPKIKEGGYSVEIPNINKANDVINTLYNGLNSRQTQTVYDSFNKVKAIGKKYLSESDFNELMNKYKNGEINEDEFAAAVKEQSEFLSDQLNSDVSMKAYELSEFIKSEERDGNIADYSKARKNIMNIYADVEPNKLSEADKLKYLFYAERIISERNFIGSGIMANKIVASRKKGIIQTMSSGIKNGLNRLERFITSSIATKEMFFKYATKTANDAIKLQEATGMTDVFNSTAEAKRSHEKLIAKYENIISKWKKRGVELREPLSIYKRSVYARLIQYKENTDAGKKASYKEGIEIIKSDIKSLSESPSPRQRAEGEILKKVFDELGLEEKTRDEFIRDFETNNPGEVELTKEAIRFFDKYKERFKENTELYNNKTFEEWYNYTPTSAKNIYSGKESTPEDVKVSQFLSGYSKIPTPGSIMERMPTTAENISYDYNFDNVMSRKALEMLLNIHTQKNYQIANAIINSKEVIDALGGEPTHKILSQNLRDKIETDFGLDYEVNDSMTKLYKSIMKYGYNTIATTLGAVTQLPKQYTPAVIDYYVTQGDITLFAPSLNHAINAIAANGLRENGVSLTNKDAALLKLLDKYPIGERLRKNPNYDFNMTDNELSKISYTDMDKKINWIKDKHSKFIEGIMKPLKRSDNFAATQTWISEYLRIKKQKGEDISKIDWELEFENPDNDAAASAESAVSTTQNISDVSSGSRLMTKKQHKVVKNIFFNLASFSLNQKARLYVDLRNTLTDPKTATRSLIGYSAQVYTFVIMQSLVREFIGDVSNNLFDPEDEEDKMRRIEEEFDKSQEQKDNEKQKEEEREKKKFYSSLINEALFSGLPQDLVNLIYSGVNALNAYTLQDEIDDETEWIDILREDLKKDKNNEDIKYEIEERERNLNQLLDSKELINIYTQDTKNYGAITMWSGTFSNLSDKISKINSIEELTPREQRLLWGLLIGDALSLGGIDEGTWRSVRNRSWYNLKKQLEDKYGGKKITITTKKKKINE